VTGEKNLIEEVTENVEALFKELWPYQDQQAPMKAREMDRLTEVTRCLALSKREISKLPKEERERVLGVRSAEEESQRLIEEGRKKTREVSGRVSDELARLTEDTYPRRDPRTPQLMYDFLLRFSRSYTKEGKQRSAGPLLEYLYTACDHAYWIWREWIAACMAVGDRSSAERLLAVLTDGQASSTQAHRFCTEGGQHRAFVVVTKGVIALKFDGDLETAEKYARTAKLCFAEQPEAIQFARAISYVRQEVNAGHLQLDHVATGRDGAAAKERLDGVIPPTALLTGKWEG